MRIRSKTWKRFVVGLKQSEFAKEEEERKIKGTRIAKEKKMVKNLRLEDSILFFYYVLIGGEKMAIAKIIVGAVQTDQPYSWIPEEFRNAGSWDTGSCALW